MSREPDRDPVGLPVTRRLLMVTAAVLVVATVILVAVLVAD